MPGDGRGLSRTQADRRYARLEGPPTIAGFGDSITAQNSSATSMNSKGYLVQACALAKQGVVFSHDLNFGVAGEKTYEILARIGSVIAAAPDQCVVLAGTNNLGLVATQTPEQVYQQIVSDLTAIYDQLQAARIFVYAIPLLPRGNWGALTSPQITQAIAISLRVNNWIRTQAYTRPRTWFQVVAGDEAMCNASNSAFTAIAGTTSDNQHPIDYGAYLVGSELANAILQRVPPTPRAPYSIADTKSAENPTGSMAVSSYMTGTSGTAGTGATGTFATGWGMARTTGSTLSVAGSKETVSPTSKSVQVLTLSSSGGGLATEVAAFSQTVNAGAGTFAAGDVLVAEFEFDNVAVTNLIGISCYAQESDGSTNLDYYALNYSSSASDTEPANASRLFRTPDFTVRTYSGSGTARVILYLFLYVKCDSGTVGGAIKVQKITLRKVG